MILLHHVWNVSRYTYANSKPRTFPLVRKDSSQPEKPFGRDSGWWVSRDDARDTLPFYHHVGWVIRRATNCWSWNEASQKPPAYRTKQAYWSQLSPRRDPKTDEPVQRRATIRALITRSADRTRRMEISLAAQPEAWYSFWSKAYDSGCALAPLDCEAPRTIPVANQRWKLYHWYWPESRLDSLRYSALEINPDHLYGDSKQPCHPYQVRALHVWCFTSAGTCLDRLLNIAESVYTIATTWNLQTVHWRLVRLHRSLPRLRRLMASKRDVGERRVKLLTHHITERRIRVPLVVVGLRASSLRPHCKASSAKGVQASQRGCQALPGVASLRTILQSE